jgi:hypothetical protein
MPEPTSEAATTGLPKTMWVLCQTRACRQDAANQARLMDMCASQDAIHESFDTACQSGQVWRE